MHITVVGTGYVGLVAGACFAETGSEVTCADLDAKKVGGLKQNILPIYEPGLDTLVERNQAQGRLHFTTDVADAVRKADVIFIAVGTPPDEDGSADLSHVLKNIYSFDYHSKFTIHVWCEFATRFDALTLTISVNQSSYSFSILRVCG